MLGSTYREGQKFLDVLLFEEQSIIQWHHLKICSFELQDGMHQLQLPMTYQPTSLKRYRDKVNKTNATSLHKVKNLFYSGQFTDCILEMLDSSEDCFIDAIFLSIALGPNHLQKLKTRFSLEQLLLDREMKKVVRDQLKHGLESEWTTKCLDLSALYALFLSQMVYYK